MQGNDYSYMEDLHVGQTFGGGPVDVTAAEIIAFASKFDPQPFHTDAEAAKHSVFGELVASGWHTAALTMRLILEYSPKMKGGMVGRSIEKLNWLHPVKPGDQLSFKGEILELRGSASNPARGIMRVRNATFNQHGDKVLESGSVIFVPRRTA